MASYSITVAVPADDAGRFIDSAAEVAGDELTMNGISFSVADPAAVVAPLRELAVADARAKADVLAAAAGCTVGPVVTHRRGWRRRRRPGAQGRGGTAWRWPPRSRAAARRCRCR